MTKNGKCQKMERIQELFNGVVVDLSAIVAIDTVRFEDRPWRCYDDLERTYFFEIVFLKKNTFTDVIKTSFKVQDTIKLENDYNDIYRGKYFVQEQCDLRRNFLEQERLKLIQIWKEYLTNDIK